MADKMMTLQDLLEHEVLDLYSAESQLIDALPAMAEAASDKGLKKALNDHLKETKNQLKRLEKICKKMGAEAGSVTCKAMQGLVKEGKDLLKHKATPEVMDAAIIGACQKVEHYEIAGYGTARALAQQCAMDEVVALLEETLNEEKAADTKLNDLALGTINVKMENTEEVAAK